MITFKIGELAILQNIQGKHGRLNGEECEITGEFKIRSIKMPDGKAMNAFCFFVKLHGIKQLAVNKHHLRKKRPPQIDSGENRIIELFKNTKTPQTEPV